MKKQRKQDKWERMADRIAANTNTFKLSDACSKVDVAAALRRVARVRDKEQYKLGYDDGFDKGFSQGYDEQMKARIRDAMERKK